MEDFGLTEYQARVYLTLLDLGAATASQIPSLSRVPRTRIYSTMNQLHEKGLVEILPEAPLKYRPVPISVFIEKTAAHMREKAKEIERKKEDYSKEFAIRQIIEPEKGGKFEAIYGRRNVREKLTKMYNSAKSEVISIGTVRSPARIVRSRLSTIEDKFKEGVSMRYAFPVDTTNLKEVQILSQYAQVKSIDMDLPMYFLLIDSNELLICHPIPNDESFLRGDDIAIWTDDKAIVEAMKSIAQNIWESGVDPGAVSLTHPIITSIRKYIDVLGVKAKPVFEGIGREIGKAIGGSFSARTEDQLLKEIADYWSTHNLGKVEIVNRDPLTIYIDNFIDCGRVPSAGKALCGFVENIVKSVMDSKLGINSVVKEAGCYGSKGNQCKLVINLER